MTETASDTVPEYAILGCGSVGHVAADRLHEQGDDLIIFDKDPSRVEALRDQDMNAVERDITDPEVAEMVSGTPVALVLTSTVEDNEEALRNLKDENPDQYVVVRANDPVSHEELEEAGADYVINPPEVIAESALRALESGEMEHRVDRLVGVIEECESLAVVVYRSFEPDEIASANALCSIADALGVDSEAFYCGSQRYQRNEAFANLLELDVNDCDDDALDGYDGVAVIDSADEYADFGFDADIVIDHNQTDEAVESAYADVGSNVGSTSTVLTKYLQEIDVDTPTDVYTGLLHGIRSETSYFRRNTTPADLTAAAYLFPFADEDLLEDLESPSMSADEFEVLADAVANRGIHGSFLVSNVGFINSPDALSWSAETLLNLEGVSTTVVFGISDEVIQVVGVSKDARVDLADAFDEAFEDESESVGHADEARVSVPLGIFGTVSDEENDREVLLELAEETVKTKLLDAMNVEEDE
ncbi:NAD-binding protein [Haladaptatus sp. F3-133]|uniref:NAD-binding protein n=1 Tax=Halorutilus salinus TaxID=2487751 RepID=A0A9Q4GJ54_9EURY|nr:NAD-binding protein [Halorutilus salinus]MCX2818901.1 NAD-binding protein [Halorutilus salinus]